MYIQIICPYQSVQLSEFSQTEHTRVTSKQVKKENLISTSKAPLVLLPATAYPCPTLHGN